MRESVEEKKNKPAFNKSLIFCPKKKKRYNIIQNKLLISTEKKVKKHFTENLDFSNVEIRPMNSFL